MCCVINLLCELVNQYSRNNSCRFHTCPAKSHNDTMTLFILGGFHLFISIPSVGSLVPLPMNVPSTPSLNPHVFFILLMILVFPIFSFPTTTTFIRRASLNN